MQRLTALVDDSYANIFHPVAEQVVSQFVKILDIHKYFDNNFYIRSDHDGGYKSSNDSGNATVADNRFTVDLQYNLDALNPKWDTTTFENIISDGNSLRKIHESIPCYYDEKIETTVTEHMVPSTINLGIKLSFTDRVAANHVTSKIHTHFNNSNKLIFTDISYNTPFPTSAGGLMLGIWKHRFGTLDEFIEHLRKHSSELFSLDANRHDPSKTQIVVKKPLHQLEADVTFDIEKPEASGSDASNAQYELDFNIVLQFSRVNAFQIVYPPVVFNKLLPINLIFVDRTERDRLPELVHPYFSYNNYLKFLRSEVKLPPEVVRYPWYDTWMVPRHSKITILEYQEFYSHIITLDDITNINGITEIDLTQLSLTPSIITALTDLGQLSLDFTESLGIAVYANNTPIEVATELTIVGNILTITTRNPFPTYRLVIAEYIGKRKNGIAPFWVGDFDIVVNKKLQLPC